MVQLQPVVLGPLIQGIDVHPLIPQICQTVHQQSVSGGGPQ